MTDQNIPAAASSHSEHTGPHRRKPWHRPRNIIILLILLIAAVIGWAVWEVLKVHHGQPAITRNFRAEHNAMIVAELGIDPVRAAEARRLLERLIELQLDLMNEILAERSETNWRGEFCEWGDPSLNVPAVLFARDPFTERSAECTALDRLRDETEFLKLFSAFASMAPALDAEDNDEPIWNTYLPHVHGARSLAEARLGMLRLAILRGDAHEIVDAIDHALSVSQSLANSSAYFAVIFSDSIQLSTLQEIRYCVLEHDPDAMALRALLDVIERRPGATVRSHLNATAAELRDQIQWSFTSAGYELPQSHPGSREGSFRESIRSRFRLPHRSEFETVLNEVLEKTRIELEKPHRKRWIAFSPDQYQAWNYPVVDRWARRAAPDLRDVAEGHALVSTRRDAVRLMIALELHQRAHGAYPDDLSALVPEFIDGLPTDTISDQPFGYRRLEEPDEFGRKYLLWSYGIDGEDNDGVEPPEDAFGNAEGTIYPASVAAMLLPAMSGYDAVLNRTREQTIRAIEKERSQWPE